MFLVFLSAFWKEFDLHVYTCTFLVVLIVEKLKEVYTCMHTCNHKNVYYITCMSLS